MSDDILKTAIAKRGSKAVFSEPWLLSESLLLKGALAEMQGPDEAPGLLRRWQSQSPPGWQSSAVSKTQDWRKCKDFNFEGPLAFRFKQPSSPMGFLPAL
eukprot:1443024-Alexandrium_andersonii.AAC.1